MGECDNLNCSGSKGSKPPNSLLRFHCGLHDSSPQTTHTDCIYQNQIITQGQLKHLKYVFWLSVDRCSEVPVYMHNFWSCECFHVHPDHSTAQPADSSDHRLNKDCSKTHSKHTKDLRAVCKSASPSTDDELETAFLPMAEIFFQPTLSWSQ